MHVGGQIKLERDASLLFEQLQGRIEIRSHPGTHIVAAGLCSIELEIVFDKDRQARRVVSRHVGPRTGKDVVDEPVIAARVVVEPSDPRRMRLVERVFTRIELLHFNVATDPVVEVSAATRNGENGTPGGDETVVVHNKRPVIDLHEEIVAVLVKHFPGNAVP